MPGEDRVTAGGKPRREAGAGNRIGAPRVDETDPRCKRREGVERNNSRLYFLDRKRVVRQRIQPLG